MIRVLLVLSVLASLLSAVSANAATAKCHGKVGGLKLDFFAKGSLVRKNDGVGQVKINGRVVAQFDGDSARINYFTRSFTIKNNRGDVVEGKLNNLITGASTLTKLILPGEGTSILTGVPVKCSMGN